MLFFESGCKPSNILHVNRSVTHATRGRDGRQEGRERGYYNLHRNLNETLFHNSSLYYSLFTFHYSLGLALALSPYPVLRHRRHLRR